MKRSVNIAGHRTSVSLEEPFWRELKRIAADRRMSMAALIAEVDQNRSSDNLSSALRLAVLNDLRRRAEMSGPSAP